MSRTILTIGLLVMGVATTVRAAGTGKKVDPTKMTCEEFVALGQDAKPRVVAWLDGYSEAGKATKEEVAVLPVSSDVAVVVATCTETPRQSLWDKIRAKLPGGKKTVPDPTKMTCEEFVGLEKDIQPEVAYWLDGYTKGAKGGKTETGPAGEVALDSDVLVVVEECRNAPKASLWEKIRKKL